MMTISARLRALALTAHVFLSVGWPGAVIAYLALAITALVSDDVDVIRSASASTLIIGWAILVPLSLLALITGVVQSLITRWGLFQHWWVVAKLALTLICTFVLIEHMLAMNQMAGQAAMAHATELRAAQQPHLLHAGVGLFLLLVITTLSVYKPWGPTPYGRRKVESPARPALASVAATPVASTARSESRTPRWALIVGWHVVALILLAVVLHLAGFQGGHLK
jgi:hypothetical protein